MVDEINEALKNAMKDKNLFKLSVLRMLKSALQNEAINKKHDLNDEEVISVIKKQVKTRKDSITEYEKYNRNQEVESLNKEIVILDAYLPEEMSEEEIEKVISILFSELKPEGIKDFGIFMKTAKADKRLQNADMSLVSKIIKAKLN